MNIDKKFLLNESKTFCMLPWVHIHVTPYGRTAACCVGQSIWKDDTFMNANGKQLDDLVNCDKMKTLRLDMLNNVENPECLSCHNSEKYGLNSWRQGANEVYETFFDEAVTATKEDGSLEDFKLRYFDIRFNNICNMKCRSCGQEWSSQWEQENKVHNIAIHKPNPKYDSDALIDSIVEQLPNVKEAYFAGGEPLITEEHYVLLEEMIRTGNNNIRLRYNTNFSNLNFKDKDLLMLWSYFSNDIHVHASVDHYGERAEYIRTGTDWGVIESNLKLAAQMPYIMLRINTLFSIYNFLTIDKFFEYMIDRQLFNATTDPITLNILQNPRYLTCQILPTDFKNKGLEAVQNVLKLLKVHNYTAENIDKIDNWVNFNDPMIWLKARRDFKVEILRLDKIRNTSFKDTFPELAPLMDM